MLDFNQAELQGAGGRGPIPEDSIVPFKMTIRPPSAKKQGNTHTLFCRAPSGNEYIDVEFEALGSFEGAKMWQNFTLIGSDMAAKISMRTLRAIIESARGVAPSDASPAATAMRQLSDWADFNSMTFLVKVGTVIEQSQKDGRYYVNNTIKKIITPDDAEYAAGESISDKPLPTLPTEQPAAAAAAAKPSTAAPAWGAPAAATAPAAPAVAPAAAKPAGPMPAWAAR